MDYNKKIRCGCGSSVSLDSLTGYDLDGNQRCKDCEAKEQDNSVFFNPSDYGGWGDNNKVKMSILGKLMGWCFG